MREEQQNWTVQQNCIKIAWQWSAAAFATGAMDNQPVLALDPPLTEEETVFWDLSFAAEACVCGGIFFSSH